MKKLCVVSSLIVFLFVAGVCGYAYDPTTPPSERNAILFSWDGVQRAHLNECLSRNELPNLAALIAEGKMVNIEITDHQTDTKAGHTQMLTGYPPEITGVYSNSKFQAIPEGLTIFEHLEKAFGDDKITTIMLTGKTHHIGSCPPSTPEQIAQAKLDLKKAKQNNPNKSNIGSKFQAIIINEHGEPWYKVKNNFDVWDGDTARLHDVVGPLMLGYLDKYGKNSFFAFFHFCDPDNAGHNKGENSQEYTDAIIACDKWLGECVKKLKELGIYDKTMVFVNADHGFDEGLMSHKNAPYVYLAANVKSLKLDGDQKDIVPTLLAQMGVDLKSVKPELPGKVLTKE